MKKIIFLVLLTGFIFSSAMAQTGVRKGDVAFDQFRFEEAIDYYTEALPEINNAEQTALVAYRVGYCYREMGNSQKAEEFFRKALKTNSQQLKPEARLYYADALRMNGKYEDAIEVYESYLDLVPDDYRAKTGIESCKVVPQWENQPSRYEVSNMAYFNSLKQDFAPAWGDEDYEIVFFTSSREGTMGDNVNLKSGEKFTDIFQIEQDRKGNWSEPYPLTGYVNTEEDEGAPTLNQKGNIMYFTRCYGGDKINIPCKIFMATKRGRAWSGEEELKIPGFEGHEVAYPNLSQDELSLYFVANTPEGFGGSDIYVMTRESPKDDWGEAVNLGKPINTSGDETFPSIRQNGTLYFSSDGHVGMGGLDIFKAEPDGEGGFETPENLRPPVNSSADDFKIIFYGEREEGYFSSNRVGGKGMDDIYRFRMPPLDIAVRGVVKDTTRPEYAYRLAGAKIQLMTDEGLQQAFETSEDGTYVFENLEEETDYIMKASLGEDYFANTYTFTTRDIYHDTTLVIDINMASIPKVIELPNIEYDFNKATLRPESTVALDELVKTLEDNPHLAIELRAHTDFRGTDEANMELSEERAQSCVNYLTEKGIDKDRLTSRGFGESMPRTVDSTLAEKHDFLDRGDILTEGFILDLPDKEQREIAHQLNRRTEFSVKSKTYGLKEGQDPFEVENENVIKKGDAEVEVGGGEF
ncbi:MAG: OmpA family protein [Bacteroidales bacterium]